jgi:hypothetical protein
MLRMIENAIYKKVPKSLVPKIHYILRAVWWSQHRKTDPAGNVYRHRSHPCINGSRSMARALAKPPPLSQASGEGSTRSKTPRTIYTKIRNGFKK